MEKLLLWSKLPYKVKMIKYSWREFQSSEFIGLIYRDVPSRKIDKKDPSWWFHSQTHMASTTICMNTKDPLVGVSMPDLSADFPAYFQLGFLHSGVPQALGVVKSPKWISPSPPPTCLSFIRSSQGQLPGWIAHAQKGPALGFLEILHFWTKGSIFSLCTGPQKLRGQFCLSFGGMAITFVTETKAPGLNPRPSLHFISVSDHAVSCSGFYPKQMLTLFEMPKCLFLLLQRIDFHLSFNY